MVDNWTYDQAMVYEKSLRLANWSGGQSGLTTGLLINHMSSDTESFPPMGFLVNQVWAIPLLVWRSDLDNINVLFNFCHAGGGLYYYSCICPGMVCIDCVCCNVSNDTDSRENCSNFVSISTRQSGIVFWGQEG